MRSPGLDVRPIRQATGESHFCEMFLDDVVIPAENLVGAENAIGQGDMEAVLPTEDLRVTSTDPVPGATSLLGLTDVDALLIVIATYYGGELVWRERERRIHEIIEQETTRLSRIVEHKDATAEQREIREINSGIYCFEARDLFQALRRVEPVNEQGEYYLTDVIGVLHDAGYNVVGMKAEDAPDIATT